jgi:hypothetical protein
LGLLKTTEQNHQRGEAMMPQTVLPFKLEITNDTLTAHAGLALLGEYCHAHQLARLFDDELPQPGSGAGYRPSQFVMPLVLMLHGGGRTLEDLRELRRDTGLRELLCLHEMPSADATGDWLRRVGAADGLRGLAAVNRVLVARSLAAAERTDYTLDIDATQIIAEKRSAARTYKGERGYMPNVGHLAETDLIVGDEFRAGNDSPGARNLEFIEYCAAQMPTGRRIARLRADSAAYQGKIFNWCEENGVSFAIGADLDYAVKALIRRIPAADWRPFQDGWIAETEHQMNATKKDFRLIVIRRPVQRELFDGESEAARHTVIASNRAETAEETVAWYNQRGEHSENRIKELKLGFQLEYLPCGQEAANAMYFRIGALAYNLFVMFKQQTLPSSWRRQQIQTIRWRLYQVAGKVVDHAGAVFLKIRRTCLTLFEEVRRRTAQLVWA